MPHCPIPKYLWGSDTTITSARLVPPNLTRLFRASPALAESHRKNIITANYSEDDDSSELADRLFTIEKEARAALKLLED